MDDSQIFSNYYDLLTKFKSTVDGLLSNGRSDIWSTYGGLRRARDIVCSILFDGLRDEMDVKLLEYLCQVANRRKNENNKEINIDDEESLIIEQYIEECLLGYSTSSLIGECFLDSNKNLLDIIYTDNAFLRNRPCVSLLVMCLNALEQNSLEILSSVNKQLVSKQSFIEYCNEETEISEIYQTSNVDPHKAESSLLEVSPGSLDSKQDTLLSSAGTDLPKNNQTMTEKQFEINNDKSRNIGYTKRRSFHQDVLMTSALAAVMETHEDGLVWFDENDRNSLICEPIEAARNRIARMREISRSESSLFNEHGQIENEKPFTDVYDNIESNVLKSKDNVMLDEILNKDDNELRDTQSLKRSSKVITASFKKGHSRSKSDQIGLPKTVPSNNLEEDAKEEKLSTSAPIGQLEEPRHQDYYYQPEDGYMFPKPYKGQSLISYLNSRSYDTGAELDKENAHFSICEALITAIEQMKCSKFFDSDSDDSDEEIKLLKRKINERKFRKKLMKIEMQQAFSDKSTSTSQSTSSFLSGSTFSSSFSNSSTDRTAPHDITSQKTLSRSWENVSLSTHPNKNLKVNDDNTTAENSILKEEIEPDDYSAEFVAKSLLKKFDGRKLPAASDLKWMVTEEQVPQTLLPLPNAWPVSPDDAIYYNNRMNVNNDDHNHSCKNSMPARLRGNFEWAPPRPQIIFTTHPYIKRKVLLQRQHYRCAGCGLKVTQSLSKRFRYCEYLGKYFCSSCHQNQLSTLPSKIISKWDLKQYPVSDFAFEFLKKIRNEPLFNISAIDSSIYKRIKPTEVTREMRLKLHYASGFLKTCRLGQSIYSQLEKLPSHIMDDIHLYSVEDFIQVKNGELQNVLKSCIQSSLKHINSCQLCKVKGFVCEYCRDGEDILYPFELNKVSTCPLCKTCYHKDCFVPEKCPKCERRRARQRLLDSKSNETEQT